MQNLIETLVFDKNAIFFAECWRKSLKIAIKTSTPEIINHNDRFKSFDHFMFQ
jgi:hypothetical protein